MSTSTTSSGTNTRLLEAALTICGRREGKTKSCNGCLRKADAALHLAAEPTLNTALLPEIANIICGTADAPCASCWDRATALLLELRS